MAGDRHGPEQESPGMVSASDPGESCVGPPVVTMGTANVQAIALGMSVIRNKCTEPLLCARQWAK